MQIWIFNHFHRHVKYPKQYILQQAPKNTIHFTAITYMKIPTPNKLLIHTTNGKRIMMKSVHNTLNLITAVSVYITVYNEDILFTEWCFRNS